MTYDMAYRVGYRLYQLLGRGSGEEARHAVNLLRLPPEIAAGMLRGISRAIWV